MRTAAPLVVLCALALSASCASAPGARPARSGTVPSPASRPQSIPAAAVAPTLAPSVYRVGAGDVLEIVVLGNVDLSRTATVQPSGTIGLPLLGEVPVSGLSLAEIQGILTERLGRDFLVNPQVEVKVTEYKSQFVLVVGEVATPGRKALRGSTRLIDVLVESGGLGARASGDVVVTRTDGTFENGEKVLRLRLARAQFAAAEYLSLELPLRGGDMITALPRSYVTVEGEVQKPGRYPIEGELTLTGALSLAGGLTRFGSTSITIQRLDPATKRSGGVKADLKAIRKGDKPDITLEDNDRITVTRRLF